MAVSPVEKRLQHALWRIYNRSQRPQPWQSGGNLPWDDPAFSQRMLREHLDDSHGAASRAGAERLIQIDWLWNKLELEKGAHLLDLTCGPGLYSLEFARRGIQVTGIDFSPASIAYALSQVARLGLGDSCRFIEQDVRDVILEAERYDAALFIYGQLAVFPVHEAQMLLEKIARALKPSGRICVELLEIEKIDKKDGSWWFTDDTGLWGDRPFLHLGERFWLADEQMSIERFQIVHLESGDFTEITLCDQAYSRESVNRMLHQAGFQEVDDYSQWDDLPLDDAEEWIVYIGKKTGAV